MRTDPHAVLPKVLAARGVRLTRPRRAVLAVLARVRRPLSVAEIYARVPGRGANLASVYRTVSLLCQLDVMRVADATRGTQRFELSERFTGHHHHLVCQRCGGIQDFDGCVLRERVLARLQRRIQRAASFRVTEHDVRLYGICGRCATA